MATTSQVKAGLDDIAQSIRANRDLMKQAKDRGATASTSLAGLPATFADVIATINGYAPTGAFETNAKDELAKMTTEFQALKATADAVAAISV